MKRSSMPILTRSVSEGERFPALRREGRRVSVRPRSRFGLVSARSGMSLIQMLVVISMIGVISMVAITTIISMLREEGRTAQVWINQHSLQRLSDDFRRDTHAARTAAITTQDNVPVLILETDSSPPKSVTYIASSREVIRRETDGDKVLRREGYRLPDCQVRFDSPATSGEASRLKSGQVVQLTCRRPSAAPLNRLTPLPLRDERVLAVIGHDHRFEKSDKPAEEK